MNIHIWEKDLTDLTSLAKNNGTYKFHLYVLFTISLEEYK